LTEMGQQFLGVVLGPEALAIYRIAITESLSFPDLGQTFYGAGPLRSRAVLSDYLTKMDAKGLLRIPDADFAASAFFGMLVARFQMPLLLRQRKDPTTRELNDAVAKVVKIFLKGVAA
jgi:TetR/AcrR family transcriptional repressor of mexJK operon